jgi:hypothetical protein
MGAPSEEELRARRLLETGEPCYVACLAIATLVAGAHDSIRRLFIDTWHKRVAGAE